MKKSRTAGFVILALVYTSATVGGVFLYRAIDGALWLRLLISDVAMTVYTFIFSLIFKNASVYDPYWSVQPPIILSAFAVANGFTPLRLCLFIAVLFWGLRLTANWAYTFHGLQFQDWRYTMLHEKTGKLYPFVNFTGIHMVPTLVVYLCVLPAAYAFESDAKMTVGSVLFCCLSLCAALLQGIADIQMHRYRKNRTTPFIRSGVWKYARHPNYLGEILMWWGIDLAVVCAMPDRFCFIAGALCNTLLFLIVSIPMADRRQAKKEGYAEYKAATRSLLPIKKFKK